MSFPSPARDSSSPSSPPLSVPSSSISSLTDSEEWSQIGESSIPSLLHINNTDMNHLSSSSSSSSSSLSSSSLSVSVPLSSVMNSAVQSVHSSHSPSLSTQFSPPVSPVHNSNSNDNNESGEENKREDRTEGKDSMVISPLSDIPSSPPSALRSDSSSPASSFASSVPSFSSPSPPCCCSSLVSFLRSNCLLVGGAMGLLGIALIYYRLTANKSIKREETERMKRLIHEYSNSADAINRLNERLDVLDGVIKERSEQMKNMMEFINTYLKSPIIIRFRV